MSPLLHVADVQMRFGGLTALNRLQLEVQEGETAGLIGPNGAGKTTTFNVITGFLRPSKGEVWFNGKSISGMAPHRIARSGLMRTFQHARPLPDLTVLGNAMAGVFRLGRTGALQAALGTRTARREEAAARERASALLDRVGLAGIADVLPSELTAGQLRLLEIARVLAAEPQMVLLDEPAAGLNRQETAALAKVIKSLPEAGITCLLVEHDVELVFEVCGHVTVLDFGEVIASGSPAEVRGDPAVVSSYLGKPSDSASREASSG